MNPAPPSGKVDTKIGSELTSLYLNLSSITDVAQSLLVIRDGYVLIEVVANVGYEQTLKSLLLTPTYGMIDTIPNGVNPLKTTGYYCQFITAQ